MKKQLGRQTARFLISLGVTLCLALVCFSVSVYAEPAVNIELNAGEGTNSLELLKERQPHQNLVGRGLLGAHGVPQKGQHHHNPGEAGGKTVLKNGWGVGGGSGGKTGEGDDH